MNFGIFLVLGLGMVSIIVAIVMNIKDKRETERISKKCVYTSEEVVTLVAKAFHDVLQLDKSTGKFYSEMNLREKANWEYEWYNENLTKKHWLNG